MGTIRTLSDKQRRRLGEFVREAILLTEEENAAIEHQIPMTQELFEQCVNHCAQIGVYFRMTCLLNEYEEFSDEYVRKIEEASAGIELPEETQEQMEASLKKLHAKIRGRYGADAI